MTEIYRLTKLYPKEELYGITNQSRRAAVSIPANIAEGYTRKYRPEYTQFLRISLASSAELETLLIIGKNLKLTKNNNCDTSQQLLGEVTKTLRL